MATPPPPKMSPDELIDLWRYIGEMRERLAALKDAELRLLARLSRVEEIAASQAVAHEVVN